MSYLHSPAIIDAFLIIAFSAPPSLFSQTAPKPSPPKQPAPRQTHPKRPQRADALAAAIAAGRPWMVYRGCLLRLPLPK
jgi:hypothetical protein